jgi:hypothetical protein
MVGKRRPGRFTWKHERARTGSDRDGEEWSNRIGDRGEIQDHHGNNRTKSESARNFDNRRPGPQSCYSRLSPRSRFGNGIVLAIKGAAAKRLTYRQPN